MAQVTFKISELNELIKNADSCVTLVPKYSGELILTFYQLSNLKQYMKDYLYSTVAKYDARLDAIVLSYKKIFIKDIFSVRNDGKTKISYLADIYTFKPKIGSILSGIVNKKSNDHVGCLVHRVFNIAIPRPSHEDQSSWIGKKLKVGQEVQFKVIDMELNEAIPYIKAELIDQIGSTLYDENASEDSEDGNEQNNIQIRDESSLKERANYKKHERKKSRNNSTSIDEETLNVSSTKSPIKHERRKHITSDEVLVNNNLDETIGNLEVDKKNKKKKRRSKGENKMNITNEDENIKSNDNLITKQKNKRNSSSNDITESQNIRTTEFNENNHIKSPKKDRYSLDYDKHRNIDDSFRKKNKKQNKTFGDVADLLIKHIPVSHDNLNRNSKSIRYSLTDVENNDDSYTTKKKKQRKNETTDIHYETNDDSFRRKKSKRNKSFGDITDLLGKSIPESHKNPKTKMYSLTNEFNEDSFRRKKNKRNKSFGDITDLLGKPIPESHKNPKTKMYALTDVEDIDDSYTLKKKKHRESKNYDKILYNKSEYETHSTEGNYETAYRVPTIFKDAISPKHGDVEKVKKKNKPDKNRNYYETQNNGSDFHTADIADSLTDTKYLKHKKKHKTQDVNDLEPFNLSTSILNESGTGKYDSMSLTETDHSKKKKRKSKNKSTDNSFDGGENISIKDVTPGKKRKRSEGYDSSFNNSLNILNNIFEEKLNNIAQKRKKQKTNDYTTNPDYLDINDTPKKKKHKDKSKSTVKDVPQLLPLDDSTSPKKDNFD